VEQQLGVLMRDAARGRVPDPDGSIDVVPGVPEGARGALLMFTAHLVVAADVAADEVNARVAPGDFASWVAPELFSWFGERVDGVHGTYDVVLVAPGERRAPAATLSAAPATFDHPRVRSASRHRNDVKVWTDRDRRGVVVVGRGLAGRLEVAFEVDPDWRGHGLGRALVATARTLVPEGEPLFAQVAPANAASMRALLAAGFRPLGAELVFHPR
jgi:GNAT superfamily N-acetyltransferase